MVTLEHAGKTHKLELGGSENILEAALERKIDVPHDCKVRSPSSVLYRTAYTSLVSSDTALLVR